MFNEGRLEEGPASPFVDFLQELGRNRRLNPELLTRLAEVLQNRPPAKVYNGITEKLAALGNHELGGWEDLGRVPRIIKALQADGGEWGPGGHRLIAQRFGAFSDYQGLTSGGELEKALQDILIELSSGA